MTSIQTDRQLTPIGRTWLSLQLEKTGTAPLNVMDFSLLYNICGYYPWETVLHHQISFAEGSHLVQRENKPNSEWNVWKMATAPSISLVSLWGALYFETFSPAEFTSNIRAQLGWKCFKRMECNKVRKHIGPVQFPSPAHSHLWFSRDFSFLHKLSPMDHAISLLHSFLCFPPSHWSFRHHFALCCTQWTNPQE